MQASGLHSRGKRDVFEAPVAQISIQQFALAVGRINLGRIDFRRQMAVRHQEVGPAVVIEVRRDDSPAEQIS